MSGFRIGRIAARWAVVVWLVWGQGAWTHEAMALAHGETAESGSVGRAAGESDARSVGVDLGSGAATIEIPVDLPPGPNDHAPTLSLTYSSQARNGLLGVGWSIRSPRITCSARFGVPDLAACERFELEGEVLVGPDESGHYHTFEETFRRVRRGGAPGVWEVTHPNGTTMTFGATPASRVAVAGAVAEWHLSSVTDVFGNEIEYTHTSGPAGDAGGLYPESIRYAGGTRSITFHYVDRPDVLSSFEGGLYRRRSQRLREIRVEVNGQLHHRLWLEYDSASSSGLSRLTSVQRFGSDCDPTRDPGPTCSALPAARFEYSDTGDLAAAERWISQGTPAIDAPWYAPVRLTPDHPLLRGANPQFADVDGDGLLDLVLDGPGRHDRPTLMIGVGHDAAGPMVHLNDGASGWRAPLWTGGALPGSGAPLNDSARWTDALRALRFDVATHRVKTARSSYDPQTRSPRPQAPFDVLFGTCRDPGDPPQAVGWIEDGGSIQFSGTTLHDPAPHFESTNNRNYPSEHDDPEAYAAYSPGSGNGAKRPPFESYLRDENWDEVATSEIRPWPHFQMVDLDADGRSDLVMSIHLSGFHLSLDDCTARQILPPGQAEWVDGATTTVVFMNTGDPDVGGGFRLDDARTSADGNLADTLPPFGIVAFEAPDLAFREVGKNLGFADSEDAVVRSPCDDYGLAGARSWWDTSPGTSYDFCTTVYDLAPVFRDFDGDGYVDLMVTKTADPDALFHNHRYDLPAWGPGWEAPDHRRSTVESVVYLQDPEATGASPRWIRAPAYDPPYAHAFVLQINGDSPGAFGGVAAGHTGNAQSYNIDKGVRFVDFNRDGLTDMLFSAEGTNMGEFGDAGGVLLNRGAVDPAGARSSAWCASSTEPGVDLCVDEASQYRAPFAFASYHHLDDHHLGIANQEFVEPEAYAIHLGDLNGDGWVDLLTLAFDAIDSVHGQLVADRHAKAYIHRPGADGSVWSEDDRFVPPQLRPFLDPILDPVSGLLEIWRSGYGVVDANGDGILDLISSEPWHAEEKPTWISSAGSARADLLVRHANGRGQSVELDYASELSQRDPAREARAAAQAEAALHDADPTNDFVAEAVGPGGLSSSGEYATHWMPRQVLASIRRFGPGLEGPAESTYRYAHPRRCVAHQEQLGFRLVEVHRPDGSRVEHYRYQEHGRAGRTAERITWDEQGRPVHYHAQDWELADPTAVRGGWQHASGAFGTFDRAHVGRPVRSLSRNEYGSVVGEDPGFETRTRIAYDDAFGFNFVRQVWRDVPGRSSRIDFVPEPIDFVRHLVGRTKQRNVHANEGADTLFLEGVSYTYEDPEGVETFGKPGVERRVVGDRRTLDGVRIMTTGYVYGSNGNLVERRDYGTDDGSFAGEVRTTRYCYDGDVGCPAGHGSFSLLTGVQDPLGRWRWSETDPVFGEAVRTWSDYADVPTIGTTLDAFGRAVARRHVPGHGQPETTLATQTWVDLPAGGLLFAGQPVSYRVARRFAEAGAAAVSESVEVSAGGEPVLGITMARSGAGGDARYTVAATSSSRDPVGRISTVSEPFPCYAAPRIGPPDYDAIVADCAAIAESEKSLRVTLSDAMGRPLRVDTPLGFTLSRYAAAAVPAGERGPLVPHDLVYEQDANGGLRQKVLAAGKPVEVRDCTTPPDPERTSLQDVACEAPRVSRLLYEPTGELRERVDPTVPLGGGAGPYAWGAEANQRIAYAYDTLGRLTRVEDPDAGTTTQTYDDWGAPAVSTDARGIEVESHHDALGRLVRVSAPGEGRPTRIAYGIDTPHLGMTQVADDGGVRWYGYDELGRTKSIASIIDGTYMRIRHTFDLMGRTVRVEYPSVFAGLVNDVVHEYDGGFLARVCDAGVVDGRCDGSEAKPIVEAFAYDALGRMTAMTLPGGTRSIGYDAHSSRLRSDRFASNVAGGGQDVAFEYLHGTGPGAIAAYDGWGNPTRRVAVVRGERFESNFAYDARNRLASWQWQRGDDPPETFDYTYDARGNLLTREGATQQFGSPTHAHAIQSKVEGGIAHAYDYDAAGHLLRRVSSDGVSRHYTFDARGRMTCVGSAPGGCDVLRVAYDAFGARVRESRVDTFHELGPGFRLRTTPGGERDAWIEFFVAGRRVGYKHVSGGRNARVELFPGWDAPRAMIWSAWIGGSILALALIAWLIWSGVPMRGGMTLALSVAIALFPIRVWAGSASGWIAWGATGGSFVGSEVQRWVLSDRLGSSLVEIDGEGYVQAYSLPKPFGGVAASWGLGGVGGRQYFAGHERQRDTGLVFMNARWLDPGTGSFLSPDPVLRTLTTTQSYNGYAYAEANPLRFTDPTGMNGEEADPWDGVPVGPGVTATPRVPHAPPPVSYMNAVTPLSGGGFQTAITTAGLPGSGFEEITVTAHPGPKRSRAGRRSSRSGSSSSSANAAATTGPTSEILAATGIGSGLGEKANVHGGKWRSPKRLKNGTRPYYDPTFSGNGATGGKTIALARAAGFKALGRVVFVAGAAVTVSDAAQGRISITRAALDLTFGVVGFMGAPGLIIAAAYFTATFTWDYLSENRVGY